MSDLSHPQTSFSHFFLFPSRIKRAVDMDGQQKRSRSHQTVFRRWSRCHHPKQEALQFLSFSCLMLSEIKIPLIRTCQPSGQLRRFQRQLCIIFWASAPWWPSLLGPDPEPAHIEEIPIDISWRLVLGNQLLTLQFHFWGISQMCPLGRKKFLDGFIHLHHITQTSSLFCFNSWEYHPPNN